MNAPESDIGSGSAAPMPSRVEVTGTRALGFVRHLGQALDGSSARADQLLVPIGEPWHEHHPLACLQHLHDP